MVGEVAELPLSGEPPLLKRGVVRERWRSHLVVLIVELKSSCDEEEEEE